MITADSRPPSDQALRARCGQRLVMASWSEGIWSAVSWPQDHSPIPMLPLFSMPWPLAADACSDEDMVSTVAARLGLADNYCRRIGESVDVMFMCATAYLVQSQDGRLVILVCRGISPAGVICWLTDLDVDSQKLKIGFPTIPRATRSTAASIATCAQWAMR